MLSRRIIACLDVRDGRVVKGVRFAGHRDMGDVVAMAGPTNSSFTTSPQARAAPAPIPPGSRGWRG